MADLEEDDMYITCATTWFREEEKKHNLYDTPWYHGPIDRQEGTKRIIKQPSGTFLLRASTKDKRAYAITVSTGGKTYIHIQIILASDGLCHIQGKTFIRVHDVIEYYSEHKYKDKVMLDKPALRPDQTQLFDENDPVYEAPAELKAKDQAPAPLNPPANDPHNDPRDPLYEEPKVKGKRRSTLAPLPLPEDAATWDEAMVQQWLGQSDMRNFKRNFYANGINGAGLLKIKGSSFPTGKFTDEDLESLDQALVKLRLSSSQLSA